MSSLVFCSEIQRVTHGWLRMLVFGFVITAVAVVGRASDVRRPNLVVVIADRFESPTSDAAADGLPGQLDQLAAVGMRFDNYVVNTPDPSAALSTLLTGKYKSTRQTSDPSAPVSNVEESLGQLLAAKGYSCHVVATQDSDLVKHVAPPFQQSESSASDPLVHVPATDHERFTAVTRAAESRLKKLLGTRQPFALFVIYDSNAQVEAAGHVSADPNRHGKKSRTLNSLIDQQIGRLQIRLGDNADAGNTIFVFTALQGFAAESSTTHDQHRFRDEFVRVPLVLRWPGKIPAGRRSNACISTVDLLPTFCGMLGVGYADSVDGIDLSDSTRVDCSCEPDFAYLRSGPKSSQQPPTVWRAIRDQHWTYARDLTSSAEFLFHNTTDPGQSKNLADHPDHIDDRSRLRQWLAEKRLVLQD